MPTCGVCKNDVLFLRGSTHKCIVCQNKSFICEQCKSSISNPYKLIATMGTNYYIDTEECLHEFIRREGREFWKINFSKMFDKIDAGGFIEDLKNEKFQLAKQIYSDINILARQKSFLSPLAIQHLWLYLKNTMDTRWRRLAANLEKAGRIDDAAKIYEFWGYFEEAGIKRQQAKDNMSGSMKITTNAINIQNAPIQKANINQQDRSINTTIVKDSVLSRSNIGNAKPFTACPYCGEAFNLPKTPKYCPYCKERLS